MIYGGLGRARSLLELGDVRLWGAVQGDDLSVTVLDTLPDLRDHHFCLFTDISQ